MNLRCLFILYTMNPMFFVVLSTICLLGLLLNWLVEVSEAIVLVVFHLHFVTLHLFGLENAIEKL